jgi:capsular polysaccharide transport system permease protein
MTTKLIVNKFRTRPAAPSSAGAIGQITPKQIQVTPEQAAQMRAASMQSQVPPASPTFAQTTPQPPRKTIADDAFFPVPEDGFGGQSFATARGAAAKAAPNPAPNPAAEVAAIKAEGLTGRQLRMARKLAQKHELPATSDFDAVRLLRNAGIDPFQTNSILELVSNTSHSTALVLAQSRDLALTRGPQLPQTVAPIPSVEERVAEAHIAEVRRIQQEIVARRRKKSILLFSRMGVFVFLPTLLAGLYFYDIATPFYSTKTEFVIQSAEPASGGGGGLSSLMKGSPLANATDSITVQGYLQSQDAMERLNADNGFSTHYSDPKIDALQRLSPTATNTSAYKTYRRNVKISFDPTEGIIKMEVIAADPNVAVDISQTLIKYAEEQVDQMTARVRNDQMAGAQQSYLDAEKALAEANEKVVALQEKNKILSSELEVGLISSQIGQLDGQLTQDRLSLAQMESNKSPNQSRMEPLKRRIATLQEQIAVLRAKLTEDSSGGQSIARVQSELLVAQADVETRRLLLAQSLQAKEAARTNVNRQTRYLSMSVNPIAADEPAYPRAFENTLVVALIFAGLYLMLSMTAAILKEQITA